MLPSVISWWNLALFLPSKSAQFLKNVNASRGRGTIHSGAHLTWIVIPRKSPHGTYRIVEDEVEIDVVGSRRED